MKITTFQPKAEGDRAAGRLVGRLSAIGYVVSSTDSPSRALSELKSGEPSFLVVVYPKAPYPAKQIRQILDTARRTSTPLLLLFHSYVQMKRSHVPRDVVMGYVDSNVEALRFLLSDAEIRADKHRPEMRPASVASHAHRILQVFDLLGASYVRQISIQRGIIQHLAARVVIGNCDPVVVEAVYSEVRCRVRQHGKMADYAVAPRASYFAAHNVCQRFNRTARLIRIGERMRILHLDHTSYFYFVVGQKGKKHDLSQQPEDMLQHTTGGASTNAQAIHISRVLHHSRTRFEG